MADRKKVAKGLRCCIDGLDMNYEISCDSGDCPYTGEDGCIIKLCSDALELLKEQERRIVDLEQLMAYERSAKARGSKQKA